MWMLNEIPLTFLQVSDLVGHSQTTQRRVIPALGISWVNLVTCRLMCERTARHVDITHRDASSGKPVTIQANVRQIEVLFAPHLPNSTTYYTIDNEGVKGL